jgi:hypothetical protein
MWSPCGTPPSRRPALQLVQSCNWKENFQSLMAQDYKSSPFKGSELPRVGRKPLKQIGTTPLPVADRKVVN